MKLYITLLLAILFAGPAFALNIKAEMKKDTANVQYIEEVLNAGYEQSQAPTGAEKTFPIETSGLFLKGSFEKDGLQPSRIFSDEETGTSGIFDIPQDISQCKDCGHIYYTIQDGPYISGTITIKPEIEYPYNNPADPHAPMNIFAKIIIPFKKPSDAKLEKKELKIKVYEGERIQLSEAPKQPKPAKEKKHKPDCMDPFHCDCYGKKSY